MIWRLKMYIGSRRIAHGCCPLCRSSPPDPGCYVCLGLRHYGPNMSDDIKVVWGCRFNEWLRNGTQT